VERQRPIIRTEPVTDFYAWTGATGPNDPGITRFGPGVLHFSAFQIRSFPDLAQNKDLAELSFFQRDEIIARFQERFVDALYRIGSQNTAKGTLGYALRYISDPSLPFNNRIGLYLVIRAWSKSAEDNQLIEHLSEQIYGLFPSDLGVYHMPIPVESKATLEMICSAGKDAAFISEVRKKEQLFKLLTPVPELSHIYIPFRYLPLPNTMIPVCEVLVKQRQRVVIDITLVPTKLTEFEIDVLKKAIVNYNQLTRDQRVAIPAAERGGTLGELTDMPADPIAQVALETFRSSLNEYATSSVFLLSCRVLSLDGSAVESLMASMARNASREFDFEVLDSSNSEEFGAAQWGYRNLSVSPLVVNNEIWSNPAAPRYFYRFHRLAGGVEASAFFRIPIPTLQGVPGFSISSRAPTKPTDEPVVRFGVFGLRGEPLPNESATLPLRELRQHAFVTGVPGSGKTTTVFSLLHQLWTEHHIPFLLIEPAKTEYRALCSVDGMKDLMVFTLGDESGVPFRFNPFRLLPGVSVEKHLNNLEGCFRGALPLSGPLPFLLTECLEGVYQDLGWSWLDRAEAHTDRAFPTMKSFYEKVRQVTESKGYSAETLSNIRAALEVRVGGMLHRSIGKMLNCKIGVDFDTLMKRPVVLELDALNEEQQALVAMFILSTVQEYVKTNRPANSSLQHVVVLEEAHNLLGYIETGGGAEVANPKANATKYFVKMLAEMRALGEGMVVADQLPSVIAPEVVKNTNWKVLLRMTAQEDRQIMGATMLLDAEQFQKTAALPPGEAYIYSEQWERPRHVILTNFFSHHQVVPITNGEMCRKMETQLLGIGITADDDETGIGDHSDAAILSMTDGKKRAATSLMLAVLDQESRLRANLLYAAASAGASDTHDEAKPTLCNSFLRLLDRAFPEIAKELRLDVYRQFLSTRTIVFQECFTSKIVLAQLARFLGVPLSEIPQDPLKVCRMRHGCQCEDLAKNPYLNQLHAQPSFSRPGTQQESNNDLRKT